MVEHTTGPLARYLPTASDHRWSVAVTQLEERRPAATPWPVMVALTLEDLDERTAPVELVLLPADARMLAGLLADVADRADEHVRAAG